MIAPQEVIFFWVQATNVLESSLSCSDSELKSKSLKCKKKIGKLTFEILIWVKNGELIFFKILVLVPAEVKNSMGTTKRWANKCFLSCLM